MNLYDYLELLQTYESVINKDLKEIMRSAKINFSYDEILLKSFEDCGGNYFVIELIIKNYNHNGADYLMKISVLDLEKEFVTFKMNKAMMPNLYADARIDDESISRIIELGMEYHEFYENPLSYEYIMRKVRGIPEGRKFIDRDRTERDNEILRKTTVELNKLPKFLFVNKKSEQKGV